MRPRSKLRSRWRRFLRHYGITIFIGLVVVCVLAAVASLMYLLSNPTMRAHGG